MNTLTKMFSLCLCFGALVFASSNNNINENANNPEPISIIDNTIVSLSLRSTINETSGSTRDCTDCEWDATDYGSACCDSAWEEFGATCATLEANYGWDCAGCLCPGDDEGAECPDGTLDDCSGDGDCCAASWLGDGFADCEDQAYGCDLTCYDNDGGDCADPECGDGACNGDETLESCPEDCTPSETCNSCDLDFTPYGSECCDSAYEESGITCAELETNYYWDCSGCECPGDAPPECGDGMCNGDETYETCPQDCNAPGECDDGYIIDCSGDGDCCPESWIGDTFEDCEDQLYGCDLTCYDNDGGDCAGCEDEGLVTCFDGTCAASEADCPDAPEVETPAICLEGATYSGAPAVKATWYIEVVCGDGICNGDETFENCPDDCNAPGECDPGYVTDCADDDCCPESWIGDGFADCEDQLYGCDLTCYDSDGGDCGPTESCEDQGLLTCPDGTCMANLDDCPEPGECDTGFIADCSGDGDCCPESWIGDGFEDCEDQAFGCDLTCYDSDGGDCGPAACPDQVECWDGTCVDDPADCSDLVCTMGEITDCAGLTVCNEATTYINYDCLFDNGQCQDVSGDCGDGLDWSCPDGVITDWIGDTFCDDGAFGFDFNCEEFNYDDGDCDARDTVTGVRILPARDGDTYNLANVKAKKGAPYSRTSAGNSASIRDEFDNTSSREIAFEITFSCEACVGGEAWSQAIATDIGFGEFTLYGFDPDVLVSATAQACDGLACGDVVGPVSAIAGAADGLQDCTEGGDPCGDVLSGDPSGDGAINVTDIVQIVNHVLENTLITDPCVAAAADLNGDGSINITDIVGIVNIILGGRADSDATSATLKNENGQMTINANGYIGGVQMTLSHGSDFSIEVTEKALVADYNTMGNITKLVVVAPDTDELFSSSGSYTIDEVIVASSTGEVNVSMPSGIEIVGAYPNPFNPSTTVSISVDNATTATIMAYDISGRVVGVVFDGVLNAGISSVTWNASSLPSGAYILKLNTPDGSASMQKVMLVK